MDYKEKYEQAIKRANAILEVADNREEAFGYVSTIFPELAESEDERMKNAAIMACKYMIDNFENSTKDYEDAINWLEKQGEQKATTVWHDVSEVPDEMQELLVEWENLDATWHDIAFYDAETKAFRHLKQPIDNVTRWAYVSDILTQSVTKISEQEQKLNEYKDAEEASAEYRKFREDCGIKDIVMLDEIKEAYYNGATSIQKSTWSEEDEEEIGIAIQYLQQAGQWDSATWLKSLKDRVRPQPRQWSEEDEDNLRFSERHFKTFLSNTYYDTFCNWLKSLKERMGGK